MDGQQQQYAQQSGYPQPAPPPQYGYPQYGQQQQYGGAPQVVVMSSGLPPPNYLAWSVVSMIFFCLPLGVAALIYSLGVSSDYASGQHAEALRKSFVARTLNIIATVLGCVAWLVGFIFIGIGASVAARIIG